MLSKLSRPRAAELINRITRRTNIMDIPTSRAGYRTRTAVGLGITLLALSLGSAFAAEDKSTAAQIARGKYLVEAIGCGDCHSPKLRGMEPDPNLLFSGHPAEQTLPPVPQEVIGAGKWGVVASIDFTAWSGPWGTSFTANLTPDKETGLGKWTKEMFVKTIRTGKHLGAGRDLLPPMPWPDFARLSDADLKAIFSYLHSLKPITNHVPAPIPPAGSGGGKPAS